MFGAKSTKCKRNKSCNMCRNKLATVCMVLHIHSTLMHTSTACLDKTATCFAFWRCHFPYFLFIFHSISRSFISNFYKRKAKPGKEKKNWIKTGKYESKRKWIDVIVLRRMSCAFVTMTNINNFLGIFSNQAWVCVLRFQFFFFCFRGFYGLCSESLLVG